MTHENRMYSIYFIVISSAIDDCVAVDRRRTLAFAKERAIELIKENKKCSATIFRRKYYIDEGMMKFVGDPEIVIESSYWLDI